MQDEEIIKLYLQRSEKAIKETESVYGRYLVKIACNILSDIEDSMETVNDVYLAAWNSIPPHRPVFLSTYLAKLTRRIAIDRLRMRCRAKRCSNEFTVSLTELDDCLSAGNTTEQNVDEHLLSQAINRYLSGLSQLKRDVFIGRYFYADSIRDIAAYCGISESKTKTMLFRVRKRLREYLIQEGHING